GTDTTAISRGSGEERSQVCQRGGSRFIGSTARETSSGNTRGNCKARHAAVLQHSRWIFLTEIGLVILLRRRTGACAVTGRLKFRGESVPGDTAARSTDGGELS